MTDHFPKDFLWGASTSAYQVEGAATTHGKGQSQQDIINDERAKQFGFADQASLAITTITLKKIFVYLKKWDSLATVFPLLGPEFFQMVIIK